MLKSLNLGSCSWITDNGLAFLSSLTGLSDLDLSGCEITDVGLANFGAFTSLESLKLNSDAISDRGLVHLGGLALQSLDLSYSKQITNAAKNKLRMHCRKVR